MPADESFEARYRRIQNQLQDAVLSQYPNPERKGCPDKSAVRELAEKSTGEGIEKDPNWYHVTHCSECYRDFLNLRLEFKSRTKRQRVVIQAVIASVLVLGMGAMLLRYSKSFPGTKSSTTVQVAYDKMTIDIPAMERSANAQKATPISLPRKPLELTVNLPTGSNAGAYEFRLLQSKQAIVSVTATANLNDGTAAFVVKVNLSNVAAGQYEMSVRQVPWDWSYYPVVVR